MLSVQLKVILKTGGWGCIHLNIKCMLFLVIQEEYKGSDIAEKCINASIIF